MKEFILFFFKKGKHVCDVCAIFVEFYLLPLAIASVYSF